MKNNKGFSLVELIIVIAIMAVLVGVLAPTYLQYVEKSKKSNDVSTVDSIVNACEIGAIDPVVMSDTTGTLTITVTNSGITYDPINANSAWSQAVADAIGTGADVTLKSSNWDDAAAAKKNSVQIVATRDVSTGKVAFTYGANTAGTFKTYASSIKKIS